MGRKFASAIAEPLLVLLLSAMLGGCEQGKASSPQNSNGDPKHGKDLVRDYGCGGCHDIPGVANADGNVGPPLQRVGSRTYIAGFLQNTPDNMAFWIRDPQKVLPGNAMPSMGISPSEARDIAAFLDTLR
jgi:cytochrome c